MLEGPALLAAVLAHPDDDTPRLVYADWLQENGQLERAEFIRVQIELARRPNLALQARESALLAAYGERWLAPLRTPDGPLFGEAHGVFRRGFVEIIWMTAGRFLERADLLFTRIPVRELRVTRTSLEDFTRLIGSDVLLRLATLDLSDRKLGDEAVSLLAGSPPLRNLRVLRLRGCGFTHAGAIALVRSPFLSGLRTLDVSYNALGPAALAALRERFGEGLVAEGAVCYGW